MLFFSDSNETIVDQNRNPSLRRIHVRVLQKELVTFLASSTKCLIPNFSKENYLHKVIETIKAKDTTEKKEQTFLWC